MTRINCVPVSELTDKHLIAEYRELPRISKLAKIIPENTRPDSYRLGAGHVKFFYDKGLYLKQRFEQEIVPEMLRRGFKPNYFKYREHPEGLNNNWIPDDKALKINRERINLRLQESKK